MLSTKDFLMALQNGDIQPQVVVELDNVEALAPNGNLLCDFGGGGPREVLIEILRALDISTIDFPKA